MKRRRFLATWAPVFLASPWVPGWLFLWTVIEPA